MTKATLTPPQKKQLAAVRKLIKSANHQEFKQGLALLNSIDDPSLWSVFSEGIETLLLAKYARIWSRNVEPEVVELVVREGEIQKRVKAANRFCIALYAYVASGRLSGVTHFRIAEETALNDVSPLSKLTDLVYLSLLCHAPSPNTALTELPDLSALQKLEVVRIRQHLQLVDLRGLAGLTGLKELSLDGCTDVEDLSPLSSLTSLESLTLSNDQDLYSWLSRNKLTTSAAFAAGRGPGLEKLVDLGPLSSLSSLRTLTLDRCNAVTDLSPLSSLSSLRKLRLSRCSKLEEFSPLSSLSSLESLEIEPGDWDKHFKRNHGSMALQSLAGLGLKRLVLSGCRGLSDLSPLSSLSSLEHLDLSLCTKVLTLDALKTLLGLRVLSLANCRVTTVHALRDLKQLESLDLQGCQSLKHLEGLEGLSSLQTLRLNGCTSLRKVRHLERLPALAELDLRGCSSLKSLAGLEKIPSLRVLNLGYKFPVWVPKELRERPDLKILESA